jgi:hypothetical protein
VPGPLHVRQPRGPLTPRMPRSSGARHQYGCPAASGPRSHSGVGLAEPGDITGRSVRRPRPQGHWPLARRIGV